MKAKKIWIALTLAVTLSLTSLRPAWATAISDAEAKRDEAQGGLEAAQAQIGELQSQQADLQGQIDALDSELVEVMINIDETKQDIENKKAELAQAQADLAAAEQTKDEQYESMKQRIRYMYENGNQTLFEALAGSQSFADILNKVDMFSSVYEADRNLLENYRNTCQEVNDLIARVEDETASLETFETSYEAQQQELEDMKAEKNDEMDDFSSELSDAESLAAQYEATIAEQNEVIAQAQAEAEARAQTEAEAQAQAEAEAQAQAEEARAQGEAEAKAEADAKAKEEADAKAKEKTETADKDESASRSQSNSSVSTETISSVKDVYIRLRQAGLTHAGACGIMGNLQQESNFNPNCSYSQYYGIAQWDKTGQEALKSYCKVMAYDSASLQGQVSYLVWSIQTRYVRLWSVLTSPEYADNVRACAEIYCAAYERCVATPTTHPERMTSDNAYHYGDVYPTGYSYYQELGKRVRYAESFSSQYKDVY